MAQMANEQALVVKPGAALPPMKGQNSLSVNVKKGNEFLNAAVIDAEREARNRANQAGVVVSSQTHVSLVTSLQGLVIGQTVAKFKQSNDVTVEARNYPDGSIVRFKGDGQSFSKFFIGVADNLNINSDTRHDTSGKLRLPKGVTMAWSWEGIKEEKGAVLVQPRSFIFLKDGVPLRGKDQGVLHIPLNYDESEINSRDPLDLKGKKFTIRGLQGTDFEELRYSTARNQQNSIVAELNSGTVVATESVLKIPANSEKSKAYNLDPEKHKEFVTLWQEHLKPDSKVKLSNMGPNEKNELSSTERQFTFTKKATVGEEKTFVTKIVYNLEKFTNGDKDEIQRVRNAYRALLMSNFEEK